MDIVGKIGEEVGKAARTVVNETNKVWESTKLSICISELETKLKNIYASIGEGYYNSKNSEYSDELDFSAEFEEISKLKFEIEESKSKLLDMKNRSRCSVCGAEIGKADVFCKKCGERLD